MISKAPDPDSSSKWAQAACDGACCWSRFHSPCPTLCCHFGVRLGETGHRPHLEYKVLLLDRKEQRGWILIPSKRNPRDDETCPWWMEGTCPLPPLLCVSATSSSPRVSPQVTMALVTSRVLVLVQTCTNTAATAAGWGGGSSVRAPVDIASADSGWLLATVMGNRLELPLQGGGGG